MSGPKDFSEINGRIAVVREEIRIVTEQAAAETGGAVEERLSERIAELEAELAELLKQRDDKA
ncbi:MULTISPECIES: hypothetical protein [Kaistia]|uniref:Uncharacterized protein n=1 Tax=Kaistia nematophila TaxID=2994654 RepID=A0A9X3IM68_9HYPH|nr:hypothetical protein [Kaistia nematophila]MBN9026242.1 hypothetical protein [Hyphomicrobiales bacterium]MCX5569570.1 hypothetical protein [Kaistia nematophila]